MGKIIKYPDNSNQANPWSGGSFLYDAVYRLINGLAVRCRGCQRITHLDRIEEGKCPDCRS